MAFCLMVSLDSYRVSSQLLTKHQINGALQLAYPNQVNASANYVNIFFIFFFTVGCKSYHLLLGGRQFTNKDKTDSMGFGPCAWIYASEIFPANCRSKGLGISQSGASLGSIIVGQVWPVAVSNIGPRVYFIFMSFNVFAAILVYSCYPETKKKTLEELDAQFGKLNIHSESEATPKQMLDEGHEHVEVGDNKRV